MPIPFFRCAKCGHTFDSFEGAEACEGAHLVPVAAETKSYSIKPFPYSIVITFNNGEKRIYNAESDMLPSDRTVKQKTLYYLGVNLCHTKGKHRQRKSCES